MLNRAFQNALVYGCIFLTASQLALSAVSSTGPKRIAAKRPAVPKTPMPVTSRPTIDGKVEKDSFVFKISEDKERGGSGSGDQETKEKTVKGEPISEAETNKLFARLPELKKDEELAVYIRPKTPVPPPPGKNLDLTFPPVEKVSAPGQAPKAPPLKVLRMSPTGEVSEARQITVTFSQPMVPIASQGELAQVPAYVSQVEGEWRWMGTQTMMFVPKSGQFPMSNTFKINIKGGLKSQTGGALPADVDFKFNTATAKVIQTSAARPGDWAQQVGLRPEVFFAFNQKINREEMAKKITFSWSGGTAPAELVETEEAKKNANIKYMVESAKKDTFLVVRPSVSLQPSKTVQISIGPDIPSAEGPNLTPAKELYEIKTYDPLTYTRIHTQAPYYDSKFSWQLEFNQTLKTKAEELKQIVKVDPPIGDMQIFPSGNYVFIQGIGVGGNKHKITIDNSLEDMFGQKLGKTLSLTAEVPHAQSNLQQPNQHFAVLAPGEKLQHIIRSMNYKKVHADIYEVTPADWGTFADYNHKFPWKKLADKDLTVPGKMDMQALTPLDLGSYMKSGKGNVVIRVHTTEPDPNQQRSYSLWLQSTNLSVDTFTDQRSALVWVTDLRTGKPVAGAKVTSTPAGDWSGVTDKNGVVKIDLTSQSALGVLVQKDGEQAFLPANMWKYSDWQKRIQSDTTLWYVASDRNLYKPGEEAKFKGWIRRMQHSPDGDVVPAIKTNKVKFTAYDGHHAEIAKGEADVNSLGGFDFSVKLPPQCNTGQAQIILQSAEGSGDSHYEQYTIAEFRRPEFELTLKDIGAGAHFIGEHTTVTASTNYFSGGTLPNTEIKWHANARAGHFAPPGWSEYSFGRTQPFYGYYARPVSYRGRGNAGIWPPYGGPLSESKNLTGKTDENGMFYLRTDFETVAPPQPVSIDLSATVQDVNRQQWTSSTNLLVHPSKHYVGVKLDRSFIQKGESLKANVIVCDLDGKLVKESNVELVLQQEEWDYSSGQGKQKIKELSKQSIAFDGTEKTLEIPVELAGSFKLIARIKDAEGRKNETVVSTWVAGGVERSPQSAGEETVTLIPDKKEYQAGDNAKILIQSPFAKAYGLLTVRRSGLVTSKNFEMNSNSTTLDIPVPEAYLPNFSVEVQLVEDNPQSKERSFARIAQNQVNIDVSKAPRKLSIDVQPEAKLLLPGSTSDIEITMKDRDGNPVKNADAVVAVVDESVLALSSYQLEDPLATMYPARSPGVNGYHLTPYVLLPTKKENDATKDGPRPTPVPASAPMLQGATNGTIGGMSMEGGRGGGGWSSGPVPMSAMAKSAGAPAPVRAARSRSAYADASVADEESSGGGSQGAIALRSNFAALALYDPSAKTDNEGRVKLKLKLPDSASRYRIMVAAASGKNFFGYADTSITAQLPLTLKPSAPRFLNVGDSFELPVVVQNLSEKAVSARIAVRANKVSFNENTGRLIEIPAKDRVEIRFPATAGAVGKARFQLVLADNKNSDANEFTLPVYTPATTETFATYGNYDAEGTIVQSLRLPTDVFPQVGELQVSTSSTALQTLTDAFIYLYKYPYACTEQLSSRILAIDALKDMLTAMHPEGLPKPEEIQDELTSDIALIERRQLGDGSFKLWDTTYTQTPYPFASVHAAHALERARIGGFKVSERTRNMYRNYLRNIVHYIPKDYTRPSKWSVRAYALYVRNLYEPEKAWDDAIILSKAITLDEAPLEVLGWMMPVLTSKPSAELTKIREYLNNHVEETASKASFVRRDSGNQNYLIYWSDSREDAVLLNGMISDQPDNDLNQKLLKSLVGHRKAGRWDNTQENAFVLMAMRKYFDKYENVKPDFLVRAWLGEDYLGEHKFQGYNADNANMDVPMSFLSTINRENKIVLSKTGKGRLYYRLALNYAPKNLRLTPMDRGFAVQRSYEAVDKKEDVQKLPDGTWKIKAGTTVRVKLTMSMPGTRHHVALVDPLPAGLEPVNPELAGNENTPVESIDDGDDGPIPLTRSIGFGRRFGWWWTYRWFEHQNLRDERAEAFSTILSEGDYNYSYLARATTPGKFVAAPTKAEEMYTPETFGRGQSDTVVVE